MSLITPEAIQSQSPNDLSLAKGGNPPAIVERSDRFGDLSLPKESFRLETLSIKAPKGFEGNVTLVCDASGAIPSSNKLVPSTNTVQKWKSGEKPAPRPAVGEWKIAMTRDGYYYWIPKPKVFLEPGEAKKLADAKVVATNSIPNIKTTTAIPAAQTLSPYWNAGERPSIPPPTSTCVIETNNRGICYWVEKNNPQGATPGYIVGPACPPRRR